MRKRILPNWQPAWNNKIEIWTINQVKKNMWRFDPVDEISDVMQEARLLFFKLTKKYPMVSKDYHFFYLYKTSLSRLFIDKSRKKQKVVETDCLDEIGEIGVHGVPNYGYLNLLVEEMPDELKTVLRYLTTGRIRHKLDRPTQKPLPRENHNMRLRRQLPIAMVDPVGDLRRFIQS
jgi:hypothetical protein